MSELPPRRLHPAGAVLSALDNVREALITLVVVFVIGSRASELGPRGAILFAVGGALVALAAGYVSWRRERYEIVDGAIRHRRGVISPDETVVPLARLHSIDTSEGPVQRLFGVRELHVQTAGGGARGEIVLRAVSAEATRELRRAAGLPEPAATELPEWRLSARELLLAALTAPQIGVLLPLVAGAAALVDRALGQEAREGLLERLPTEPAAVAVLVAALAAGVWLLSFAGAVIAFGGFAVARDGDRLLIRRGILQRRVAAVPLRRVHAATVIEGPLRQPLGLCSVRLETAGYGREPAAARTLFPLLRLEEVDSQLAELVPALAGGLDRLERPPGRALRRYVLRETLAGIAAGIALTIVWSSAWPAIPLLAALGALDGALRYRNAGWRLSGERLALRRGALLRRTLIARADRLQDESVAQSPFQRRAGLASLGVTVASGASGAVAHLESSTATALLGRLRPAHPPTPGA